MKILFKLFILPVTCISFFNIKSLIVYSVFLSSERTKSSLNSRKISSLNDLYNPSWMIAYIYLEDEVTIPNAS